MGSFANPVAAIAQNSDKEKTAQSGREWLAANHAKSNNQ